LCYILLGIFMLKVYFATEKVFTNDLVGLVEHATNRCLILKFEILIYIMKSMRKLIF
jgi:hypothetical protein